MPEMPEILSNMYVLFLIGLLGMFTLFIQNYRKDGRGQEEGLNAFRALGRYYLVKHPFRTLLGFIGYIVTFAASVPEINILTAFGLGLACMEISAKLGKG